MSNKVDPNLIHDLKHFGLSEAQKCYNCGNCTAICPLSTPENPFPRKFVRYIQMGQTEKILKSPEPWLCYYCGDCSTQCPRGAEPGETMMALRRYLTAAYDWTGFARKFYTSERFEIIAISIVALLVGMGLLLFHGDNIDWQNAHINSVWPSDKIELADLGMAAILSFLLLSNVFHCFKYTMGDLAFKIPVKYYASQAKELLIHVLTQKRFGQCTDKMQWFVHLMIMTGYASVFLLVVVFINGLGFENLKFQRDLPEYPLWHPIRLVGYYATFAIMYGTTYAIIGRLKKSKPVYRYSHPTDWMFLILLQLTTMTGIFIHFTRLLNWPIPTYGLYIVHMMVAVPMLVLEVPFAKWAHLAYRPLVIYLVRVKQLYLQDQPAPVVETEAQPAVAPAE
ncbi:MAG: 4Fe-4S dicluster domain-containing protein [Syntrophobacteraceae bacterium]|jgi:ferredoxin|nr:4Fe-4S dicluster domain-containing protein [Syntrophobacteraceae bacterium]